MVAELLDSQGFTTRLRSYLAPPSMPWTWILTVALLVASGTASTQTQSRKVKIQKWIWNQSQPQDLVRCEAVNFKVENRKKNYQKTNLLDSLEKMIKVGNYQFLYEGEVKRTSYYLDLKFTHLNYLRNFQSSTSNLNNFFLENPYLLNSCKVKNKEAETYLNYTTENYLRYKMERKMKEAKEKKEEAGKEGEVKEGGEERKKRRKGGKKEKEVKEEEDQEGSWQSLTRSGLGQQEGHQCQRCRSSPGPSLRNQWLRCKQRCTVSHQQKQSPAPKQSQRPSQKQRRGPRLGKCGWMFQSNHPSIDLNRVRQTTYAILTCGVKLNKTGWSAMQVWLEQPQQRKQSKQRKQSQQRKQSHRHKQSHQPKQSHRRKQSHQPKQSHRHRQSHQPKQSHRNRQSHQYKQSHQHRQSHHHSQKPQCRMKKELWPETKGTSVILGFIAAGDKEDTLRSEEEMRKSKAKDMKVSYGAHTKRWRKESLQEKEESQRTKESQKTKGRVKERKDKMRIKERVEERKEKAKKKERERTKEKKLQREMSQKERMSLCTKEERKVRRKEKRKAQHIGPSFLIPMMNGARSGSRRGGRADRQFPRPKDRKQHQRPKDREQHQRPRDQKQPQRPRSQSLSRKPDQGSGPYQNRFQSVRRHPKDTLLVRQLHRRTFRVRLLNHHRRGGDPEQDRRGEKEKGNPGTSTWTQKECRLRCPLLLGDWHLPGCKSCGGKAKMIKEKESEDGDLDLYGKDFDLYYNQRKKEGKESMKEKSKEEEKEKMMDTNAVKFAEVSLCGAARARQKEVRSVAFWKKFCESEAVVVKFMLVVIMTVCMYMFSVVEKVLEKMVLDSARWQDWYLSGRWQDWTLSQAVGNRHPSRKGLSKANSFRKRRLVKRRLALVGQVFKVMMFILMDTVHAMQHGPESNPAVGNGPASGSAEAPSADQVLTQVLRQNTEALQKLALGSTSSSGEVARNLESASRILRNPDYFGGADASEATFGLWKHQFSNWLTFGDDRFRTLLEAAESQQREATMEDFSQEGKQLSRKLYRILTSYLKGPALSITRSIRQSENGFLVWQRLNAEYRPLSRQRGMALAQVLATYPAFPKDKSVMECILALEEVVHQYNQVTGEEYPKSLLMGTLIRCSPPNLRQHLQLTLQNSSTYKSVKETMLLYEKTTKAWSSESVLKEVGATQGARQDEPTPMEIDQAQAHYKGKGKGKGKGKSKGKSSWSSWGVGAGSAWKGRGRGKGKGGRKGKGKSKGKKGKGKTKGKKGSKGGNKGGSKGDRCRLFGQSGHWGNECPNRMMVGQAAETNITDNASTQAPPSSASTSTGSDRRVKSVQVRRKSLNFSGAEWCKSFL